MIAGGAKSRKQKSASEVRGTSSRSTTSYQPQMPLPSATMADETANSTQAGRCRRATVRMYARHETVAARAAPESPKSPITTARSSDPHPRAAPVA